MKFTLINTGKTEEKYIQDGLALYEKRLLHYCSFENTFVNVGSVAGKLPVPQLKLREAEIILKKIKPEDFVVLLDENGKQMKSQEMAAWMNEQMIRGTRHLVFITGGAYGFHESMHHRANLKLSLSLLTFPHQLVRLIFLEQLYRAFTIIRGEPYH
ncbi:MAG: 23S rRNA (pseudouridine(1915)-N(3))-methyltransferase RlmH, partial [Bacteroidales bacterium]|nr:23S rRNA (pseudouridine(1915)-N(3))-methyltransferase RlmH [Bacteroidales bacterium]